MNTILLYTLGVVAFAVALVVSVGLHEAGHLLFAKLFGARVSQYFIGFGRTLWSTKKNNTEYGIKLYPLGGFVRIIGMFPPKEDKDTNDPNTVALKKTNTGMFTSLIDAAKKTEYENVNVSDGSGKLFYTLPWYKKMIVMLAGPSVNIVLAFLCFLGVFAFYGQHELTPNVGSPVIAHVEKCMSDTSVSVEKCSTKNQTPAFNAGLHSGDQVISFNGKKVETWTDLTKRIYYAANDKVSLTVLRGTETLKLSTIIAESPNVTNVEKGNKAGFLGVTPQSHVVVTKHGVAFTGKYMVNKTTEVFSVLKVIPQKVGNVFLAIIGVEDRDPAGPVSIVGGARISGEMAAYQGDMVSDAGPNAVQIKFTDKIASFFMLVAAFNMFIGIINLLPILPLDGGHILGALWEGIRNGFRRLLKKTRPSPVDISKMLPIAYVFGMFLFLIGAILIIGDIVVPLKLMH